MIELVESVAWGDIDGAIRVMDEALLMPLGVRAADFERWVLHSDEAGYTIREQWASHMHEAPDCVTGTRGNPA